MKIGVPREIKEQEYRIGMVPQGVAVLTKLGHEVFVEKDGGLGSGITNAEYENAGAKILAVHKQVFNKRNSWFQCLQDGSRYGSKCAESAIIVSK